MLFPTVPKADPKSVLEFLITLLNSDAWKSLQSLIQRWLKSRSALGLYEVLNCDTRLELHDMAGHHATYTKNQKVRLLQNNVIAYQDSAWGDGTIFADYRCSPGKAVDQYREGHRHWILVSLRETKHRGEQLDLHVERQVKDGFLRRKEEWQTEVNHLTQQLSVTIVFPCGRWPKQVQLVEQNISKTSALDSQHRQILADGRCQIRWQATNPRLYEAYILRWEW